MAHQSRDRGEFDPRFDPAFQPGYDEASDPTVRASALHRAPPGDAAVAPPPPAVPPRPTVAEVDRPSAEAGGPSVEVDAHPGAASSPEPRPAGVRDLTRNPFVIALWVLGIVFIVFGAGILRWISMALESLNSSGDAGFDYLLVQAMQVAGPLSIVLGFAILSATLFLFAARWRAPDPG